MKLISDNGKSKRGRKPLGNILFARRVKPSMIPVLLKAIMNNKDIGTKHVESQVVVVNGPIPENFSPIGAFEVSSLKAQNWQLAEENEKLTKDNQNLAEQVQRVLGMSDDTKVHYWRSKCQAMEKAQNDGSF